MEEIELLWHHVLTLKQFQEKSLSQIEKLLQKITFPEYKDNTMCYSEESAKKIAAKLKKIYNDENSIVKIAKNNDYFCNQCHALRNGICMGYEKKLLDIEDERVKKLFPKIERKKEIPLSEILDTKLPSMDELHP